MAFRQPSERELAILGRLPEPPFPGRDELRAQLEGALVQVIEDYRDNYGSIEFRISSDVRAPVLERLPVFASAFDEDGAPIEYLLHVVDGRLAELEGVKYREGNITRHPDPGELHVPQPIAFRRPSERELAISGRLLGLPFPGRDELATQLDGAFARTIHETDQYTCIDFHISSGTKAGVRQDVPVEAIGVDEDGSDIRYRLNVAGGIVYRLEFFKVDGTPMTRHSNPQELHVFIPDPSELDCFVPDVTRFSSRGAPASQPNG